MQSRNVSRLFSNFSVYDFYSYLNAFQVRNVLIHEVDLGRDTGSLQYVLNICLINLDGTRQAFQ